MDGLGEVVQRVQDWRGRDGVPCVGGEVGMNRDSAAWCDRLWLTGRSIYSAHEHSTPFTFTFSLSDSDYLFPTLVHPLCPIVAIAGQ